eukprot:6180070-Pleurochrysis_carterae.AAC.1
MSLGLSLALSLLDWSLHFASGFGVGANSSLVWDGCALIRGEVSGQGAGREERGGEKEEEGASRWSSEGGARGAGRGGEGSWS